MPAVPFKAHAARRHHIPKQRHRVTNWAEYDAALRQRGSLTVWFTEAAIAAWRAEPRTTPGGQPHYSALAILTALTLRAVFRLALRPDGRADRLHPPPARPRACRARSLDHRPACADPGPCAPPPGDVGAIAPAGRQHGPQLGGPGEWLTEKHRHKEAPILAQAAPRRGRRHRRDRRGRADEQRGR